MGLARRLEKMTFWEQVIFWCKLYGLFIFFLAAAPYLYFYNIFVELFRGKDA